MMSGLAFVVASVYVNIVLMFGGCFCHLEDTCGPVVGAGGSASSLFALTAVPDRTLIQPSGGGAPHRIRKTLKDLPDLRLSHQVAEGQLRARSFCWQFNHSDGDVNNRTEDAIFAAFGLLNTSQVCPDPNVDSAILAAHDTLLAAIVPEGMVRQRLSQEGTET